MFNHYEPHFKDLEFETFVDMFGGSSTMSMWIHKNFPDAKIVINELNKNIVGIFLAIRDSFPEFREECDALESEYLSFEKGRTLASVVKNEKIVSSRSGYYYSIRGEHNKALLEEGGEFIYSKSAKGAAKMFFLMKTCFNGIWQGSKATPYSTPHGNGGENYVFDWDVINDYKEMFSKSEIIHGSFEGIKDRVDFVSPLYYADPPYLDSKTEYTESGFGIKETTTLCEHLLSYEKFALSNKNHPVISGILSDSVKYIHFNVKYTATRKDTKASSAVEILAIKS